MRALHSAASVEHYTPHEYVEAARLVLGDIDLDPASSEYANRVVQARSIYTEADDGLSKPWFGNVFVNPPGKSKGNPGGQAAWWKKLTSEFTPSGVGSAIFLGFSLELLQTVQSYANTPHPLNFSVCIPKKRINFEVRARDLLSKLEAEYAAAARRMDHAKMKALVKRISEAERAADTDDRVAGTSPTHGNIIVFMGPIGKGHIFKDRFSTFGYVRR